MSKLSIEEEIAYHRSFLKPGAPNPVVSGSHELPDRSRSRIEEPKVLPNYSNFGGSQFPVGPQSNPPTRRGPYDFYRQAYTIAGEHLLPSEIVEKYDQNFAKYATSFERGFSKLVSTHNDMTPVVDSDLMVVGHIGTVSVGDIWLPKGSDVQGITALNDSRAGTPAFVGEPSNSKLWRNDLDENRNNGPNILTRVDGLILYVLSVRGEAGVVSESFSPLDIILITKILVDFGEYLGRRMSSALIRKKTQTVVRVLEGPTESLAKEAASREASSVAPRLGYFRESGIPPSHYKAFQEAARETNVIAVVRNGKESAIPLIERGCPGKPKIFEPFNTNERTGILTATTEADKQLVYKSNYILVDENRIATRRLANGTLEKVELKNPFWELEPGQVIDPKLMKPVVGDYDLMGVFSPQNAGQNITLHSVNGAKLENMTSPVVDKFSKSVNAKFDFPRVLHGAQDQYAGFRKGAIAFFPDGTVQYLETQAQVEEFYASVGRQPIKGAYPRPGPDVPVTDELAARRGRK